MKKIVLFSSIFFFKLYSFANAQTTISNTVIGEDSNNYGSGVEMIYNSFSSSTLNSSIAVFTGDIDNFLTFTNNTILQSIADSGRVLSYTERDIGEHLDVTVNNSRNMMMISANSVALEINNANDINSSINYVINNNGTSSGSSAQIVGVDLFNAGLDSVAIRSAIYGDNSVITINNGEFGTIVGDETAIDITGTADVTINNSGLISSYDSDSNGGAIIFTDIAGNNIVINNTGTISGFGENPTVSETNAIIINNATSAATFTLNIGADSTIAGNVVSNDSNVTNTANIRDSLTLAEFNTLNSQLIGTWTVNIDDAGSLTVASGETASPLTMSGGTVTNNGSVSSINVASGTNTLNLGSSSTTGNIANSGALSVGTGSDTINYSNVISGTGSLTKTGTGILNLTGANTYTGDTTVSAGNLKVNGSLAATNVTVASAATVSGTGTLGGDVTIASGGNISPGNSIGTMNVTGDLTLANGSNTNIEYSDNNMDAIAVTGDAAVDGTINLSRFGTSDIINNGVVSKNIITANAVTGTFDAQTLDDANYIADLSYSTNAVRATVARKVDENYADAALFAHNNTARMVSNVLESQILLSSHEGDSKKLKTFASVEYGDAQVNNNGNSQGFNNTTQMLAVGAAKSYGEYDVIGTFFSSKNDVDRGYYNGNNDIMTNGIALGVGKRESVNPRNFGKYGSYEFGSFYNFAQAGIGFIENNQTRDVNVNGVTETAKADGSGEFYYAEAGTHYIMPLDQKGKKVGFSGSFNIQQVNQDELAERGLSQGNFTFEKSTQRMLNLDLGVFYQDRLTRFIKIKQIPHNTFFNFEVNAYQSNLYNKEKQQIRMGNAVYNINPVYNQGMTFGGAATVFSKINDSTSLFAKVERRSNEILQEFFASVALKKEF